MTVRVALALDCNGSSPHCRRRFIPPTPMDNYQDLRTAAAVVGWEFRKRQRLDLCQVCRASAPPVVRLPRGDCPACGRECPLTLDGCVKQHYRTTGQRNKWGRKPLCRGGGELPRTATLIPRQLPDGPYPGWRASA